MEYATMLKHQNFMWGLRKEMGWPLFKPANDCIGFSAGRPMDIEIGMELGRIAQESRRDLIYAGWETAAAAEPTAFAVVMRELIKIDVIGRCFPWCEDEHTPVILVSTHADERFAIGRRGLLERSPAKPKKLGAGRKLAMKRIRAAAAQMGDELAANNVWLPHGAAWAEPDALTETIVSFG